MACCYHSMTTILIAIAKLIIYVGRNKPKIVFFMLFAEMLHGVKVMLHLYAFDKVSVTLYK